MLENENNFECYKRPDIVLTPFCYRQFVKNKVTVHIDYDKEKFTKIINEQFSLNKSILLPGYADFSKHFIVENFTTATVGSIPIDEENINLIETVYEARNEKELPVLKRFIRKEKYNKKLRPARYLDIILYARSHILNKEKENRNETSENDYDYLYGIISIIPKDTLDEIPMDPITHIRNSLGKEYGGSGVKLDIEKYLESVKYWSSHVLLK